MHPPVRGGESEGLKGERWEVQLQVNGKPIPLKPFVRQIICSTILGMVSSLKRLPVNLETVTVTLRRLEE
jgi:hypothetical protein